MHRKSKENRIVSMYKDLTKKKEKKWHEQRLKEIEIFQWLERKEIEKYQLKRLQNLIHFINKNVPFYQNY